MKKSIFGIFLFLVTFGFLIQVDAKVKAENFLISNNLFWHSFEEADVELTEDPDNPSVNVSNSYDYCSDPNFIKPFIFLGRIFSIVKILIPILIIIFGMVDLFKAVIGSKDDEIKKSIRSLLFRAIAGVIIFFIPTIVHLLFLLIDDWKKYETSYSKCSLCISSPSKCSDKLTSNE